MQRYNLLEGAPFYRVFIELASGPHIPFGAYSPSNSLYRGGGDGCMVSQRARRVGDWMEKVRVMGLAAAALPDATLDVSSALRNHFYT